MKTKLLLLCVGLVITGCVPSVTYEGRFATYQANPSGFVITPYYAK